MAVLVCFVLGNVCRVAFNVGEARKGLKGYCMVLLCYCTLDSYVFGFRENPRCFLGNICSTGFDSTGGQSPPSERWTPGQAGQDLFPSQFFFLHGLDRSLSILG